MNIRTIYNYVNIPAGDMPDSQRDYISRTVFAENSFRGVYEALEFNQKARMLVFLSYDYILCGFEERADILLIELDTKHPSYLTEGLLEDMKTNPKLEAAAEAVAEYYFQSRFR